MCSESFVGHFGYLSNFIKWNVAGVPDTMLYFGLFCCGGLPAFPLEHRWHVDHNCLLWKHSVAILHPCLSRGIHCWFLLLSYLFMSRVSGFYSSFFAWCFLGKQKKKFSLLMAAATFEGASLGPLFDLANAVDPRYVWPINQSVAIVTCSIYLC